MLTNVTRFQKGSLKLQEHAYYYVALFIYYFIGAKVKDSVANFGSFFLWSNWDILLLDFKRS